MDFRATLARCDYERSRFFSRSQRLEVGSFTRQGRQPCSVIPTPRSRQIASLSVDKLHPYQRTTPPHKTAGRWQIERHSRLPVLQWCMNKPTTRKEEKKSNLPLHYYYYIINIYCCYVIVMFFPLREGCYFLPLCTHLLFLGWVAGGGTLTSKKKIYFSPTILRPPPCFSRKRQNQCHFSV